MTSSSTEDATYRLLSGTLDLDCHGKRAYAGKRFLSLNVRVTNNSTFGGGLGMGDDNFRILADGTAIAPDNFINEVQSAQTDKEVRGGLYDPGHDYAGGLAGWPA